MKFPISVKTIKRYFDDGAYVTTDELERLYKAYQDLIDASKEFGSATDMSHKWACVMQIPVRDKLRARNVKGY
jgi:hypothetical protein